MGKAERQHKRLAAGWQAIERNEFRSAEEIARAELRKNSSDPIVAALLGTSLFYQGRFEEALTPLRRAFQKAHAEGLGLILGQCSLALGDPKGAEIVLARETALFPDLEQATNLLGIALAQQAQLELAASLFASAVRRNPNFAEAHLNLGNVLHRMGRYEDAVLSFQRTIELNRALLPAHNGLGNAYRALGRLGPASACYQEALRIAPEDAETLCNLGVVLADLGHHEEAVARYRAALSFDPGLANAHYNLGITLQELKRHEEAIGCFERALEIEPAHKEAFGAQVMSELGVCRWDKLEAHIEELRALARDGRSMVEPFTFLLVSPDPAEQRRCVEHYVRNTWPVRAALAAPRTPHARRAIRVAYVSANFREHAAAYLAAGLFELHDRSRFETIGVSLGLDDRSEMRTRLAKAFDRFIDARAQDDAEVASLLRDLELDIAVDLMGYTGEARPGIFTRRPAPIQVNYLGYPGTMGADFIDYILADEFVLPREHQAFYSEKVAYLPDCYLVNDSTKKIAERTPSRTELGLPSEGFVFCSFNINNKITPHMFQIWMRLLEQVPGSVLWLLEDNLGARQNLQREAQARGVEAGRLVFAPRMKLDQHLARHRCADLFLDTLPYNAHTTASDALWTGLPVLTCPGGTFVGRVAGSLLRTAGLPELVVRNLKEYEALALRLARNDRALRDLRAKLVANRTSSPLFDTDRFRRNIESAYTTMQEIWRRGEQPRTFAVIPS